jgi:hypothetical protein
MQLHLGHAHAVMQEVHGEDQQDYIWATRKDILPSNGKLHVAGASEDPSAHE